MRPFAGVTLLYANAQPGSSLDALSKDLLGQAHQLAAAGPSADELQRVKKVRAPFGREAK